MTYYALTDSDWPWTDIHEGKPVILLADSPHDAVERATEKYMEENPYSGGVCWKVAKVIPVGFESANWEDSCHPNYQGFTQYTDVNTENERVIKSGEIPPLQTSALQLIIGLQDGYAGPDVGRMLGYHAAGNIARQALGMPEKEWLEPKANTPSPQTNVAGIKPLEWSAANEGFGHGRTHYGSGVFGHWYGVKRIKTGVWECFHHVGGKVEHLRHQVSLDDAKAAAQADYVSHMLSALVPSPQTNVPGSHLRAVGIGRDPENDQVVFLSLNRRPSDDEVRAIHGAIGRTPASCPFCAKPTYVLPCSHCGEPDVPDNQF